jgi:hypothetical protein
MKKKSFLIDKIGSTLRRYSTIFIMKKCFTNILTSIIFIIVSIAYVKSEKKCFHLLIIEHLHFSKNLFSYFFII